MRTLDKFFVAIGTIGTVGAIVAGFLGQRLSSLVMLGLFFMAWQIWLTIEVIALRKIGVSPAKQASATARRWYLDDSLFVSSEKLNPLKISADFLLWPKCTVMLWVWVPPKGKGLRDSPNNRYLFAHHTGKTDDDRDAYKNQFVLRHSRSHNRWEFLTSNGSAEYGNSLNAKDGLEPGWHHFLIAWDRPRSKTIFLIDGASGGSDVSNVSFRHWPEEGDKLFVGTWVSEWEGHFCETKLLQLRIFDDFLTGNDTPVQEQLLLKPRA